MNVRQILPIALISSCIALSLAAALDPPASDWHMSGPFGGSATSLALDPQKPNILLAGGMNSLLFRSADAGENWALLDFPKRNLSEVTSVVVDPTDSSHYLAGIISADGGGMFSSHDQGQTWAPVNDIKDFGVRSIVFAPSKPSRVLSGTLRGVMMSEDSGASWSRMSDPKNLEMQGITATAIDPSNPDVLYAGTSHLPWKSIDGGKTWHSIHEGMTDDSDVFSIYVNPIDPLNVFASACSGIYTSADRGDKWRKVMGLTFSQRRTHVIRKDPHAEGVIYAGTTMGLFKSPNMGAAWKLLSKEQVNALVFDPAAPGSMFMAMEYEGLSRATETGERIKMLNHGFVDRSMSGVTRAGDKLIALETQLGESTGVFVSRDKGESWSQMLSVKGLNGIHLKTIAAVPSEDRILLAAAPHEMYKSMDGGSVWKPLPLRLLVEPPAPAKTTVAAPKKGAKAPAHKPLARKPVETLHPIAPSEIYGLYALKSGAKDLLFAATDLGLLRTADAGERWTMAAIPGASSVQALFLAPNNDGRLMARAPAGLFLSKDFGEHWAPLAFPIAPGDVNDIALPADPADPILVATRLGLYSSADDGAQWSTNPAGIPASTVNSIVYAADKMAYAAQYGKLWQSKDCGKSWSQLSSVLPPPRIRRLWVPDIASNRLYAVTSDLGILFRN